MVTNSATAILVAGMHRSGTSALAGTLSRLGISLGERLLEPGSDNPKGYWEHKDAVAVHERLLAELGSRWDDVRALPENWLATESARRASTALTSLVARDFLAKSVWAIKDPRLCRFMPLWLEVLRQLEVRAIVMFMVRKPSEVSASIEARNGLQRPIGELLWLRHVIEAENASRGVPRSVVVYDDLLTDPLATVTAALTTLGVHGRPSEQEGEAVKRFVDRSARHHDHATLSESPERFVAIAEEIYKALVATAHGADAWRKVRRGEVAFEHEWRRSGTVVSALAGAAAKRAAEADARQAESCRVASELTAQIRWSEEAVARLEALHTENAELVSKLTAQIRWSDEAVARLEALRAENAELASKLAEQFRRSDAAVAKQEVLRPNHPERSKKLSDVDRLADEIPESSAELFNVHEQLAEALRAMTNERDQATESFHKADAERALFEKEIRRIRHSLSWRITRPMRVLGRMLMSWHADGNEKG